MRYLVAVEHPCEYCEYTGNLIKVTNDIEGFGPGLLASYPILPVETDTPQLAAYRYAQQHKITHSLIIINLPGNSDEWWMEEDQAHKVDLDTEPIWEAKTR